MWKQAIRSKCLQKTLEVEPSTYGVGSPSRSYGLGRVNSARDRSSGRSRPRTSPCSQGLHSAPSSRRSVRSESKLFQALRSFWSVSQSSAKKHHRSCPRRSPSASTDRAPVAAQTGWLRLIAGSFRSKRSRRGRVRGTICGECGVPRRSLYRRQIPGKREVRIRQPR